MWVSVGACSCCEGAGSVRGAVRWLRDARGTRCGVFGETAGDILLEVLNVCG